MQIKQQILIKVKPQYVCKYNNKHTFLKILNATFIKKEEFVNLLQPKYLAKN